jgi:molybdopterin-guanine dinucleotide biosynthesis protein A
METAIVILAGGEGRRIGGGKPQRELGGRSLIDRALEFAHSLAPLVAIAVREPDQLADCGVARVLDLAGIEGPLAGVGAALGFAAGNDMDALLTLPCDAPFLPGDLLARLFPALAGGIAASVPQSGGVLHPACALWRIEALNRLPAYLEARGSSLRGFAEHVGCTTVDWPVEPVDPFFNINSEEDLARAENLLGSG